MKNSITMTFDNDKNIDFLINAENEEIEKILLKKIEKIKNVLKGND